MGGLLRLQGVGGIRWECGGEARGAGEMWAKEPRCSAKGRGGLLKAYEAYSAGRKKDEGGALEGFFWEGAGAFCSHTHYREPD